jgi:hypothetical protein
MKSPRKKAPPSAPAVESKEPKVLQLDQITLLKMEKFQAIIRACTSESQNVQALRRALMAKIDPQGHVEKLDSRLVALREESRTNENSYKTLMADVEAKLGIKMSDYSYDDETGALHHIGQTDAAKT